MPVVSVIIAAYNWSSVLRYAIRSVLWQDFADFEVWVVGDHCTDDSQQVVDSFGDSRLRWYNLPENTGNQAGPNGQGLRLATGDYIAYLNQDDIWFPHHLKLLVDALRESSADFGHSYIHCVISPDGRYRRVLGPDANWYRHVPVSAIMHRREFGLEIGGWTDYRQSRQVPTLKFWQAMNRYSKRIAVVPSITVTQFPSVLRERAYERQPSGEQAELVRRISESPDALMQELEQLALAYVGGRTEWADAPGYWHLLPPPLGVPAGWLIEEYRRLRGLPVDGKVRIQGPLAFVTSRLKWLLYYTFHRMASVMMWCAQNLRVLGNVIRRL